MRRWCLAAATLAAAFGLSASEAGAARDADALEVYSAVVRAAQLADLNDRGVDMSVRGRTAGGTSVSSSSGKAWRPFCWSARS